MAAIGALLNKANVGRVLIDAKLQELIDETEIKRVHIRYCRGIDRMDWDLTRSCYHPDASDRHGAFEGDVDGFIAWTEELLPTFESTHHFSGNQFVKVARDAAYAEHYAQTLHRRRRRKGLQPRTGSPTSAMWTAWSAATGGGVLRTVW